MHTVSVMQPCTAYSMHFIPTNYVCELGTSFFFICPKRKYPFSLQFIQKLYAKWDNQFCLSTFHIKASICAHLFQGTCCLPKWGRRQSKRILQSNVFLIATLKHIFVYDIFHFFAIKMCKLSDVSAKIVCFVFCVQYNFYFIPSPLSNQMKNENGTPIWIKNRTIMRWS